MYSKRSLRLRLEKQLIYINGPNVKMRFKNSAAFLMFTFNIDFIGR